MFYDSLIIKQRTVESFNNWQDRSNHTLVRGKDFPFISSNLTAFVRSNFYFQIAINQNKRPQLLVPLITNLWNQWICYLRGKRSFLLVCPDSGVLTPVCGCFNLCFFLLCPPYLCCVWWLFGMVTGGRFLIAVGSS